jgi:hypothetical protein
MLLHVCTSVVLWGLAWPDLVSLGVYYQEKFLGDRLACGFGYSVGRLASASHGACNIGQVPGPQASEMYGRGLTLGDLMGHETY